MPALVSACMCLSKYDSETPWNSAMARPGQVPVGLSTASRTVQWSAHSTPALIRMESRIFRVLDSCQTIGPGVGYLQRRSVSGEGRSSGGQVLQPEDLRGVLAHDLRADLVLDRQRRELGQPALGRDQG